MLTNAGIQVFLNSTKQSEAAKRGLEKITELIKVYRVRQIVHCSNTWTKSDDAATTILRKAFRTETVKLYAKILNFQIRLACMYTRLSVLNYWRDLFKVDDWESSLVEIGNIDTEITKQTQALDSNHMNEALRKHSEALERIENLSKAQLEMKSQQEMYKCLQNFSSQLDYTTLKDDNPDRVDSKTSQILLNILYLVQVLITAFRNLSVVSDQ